MTARACTPQALCAVRPAAGITSAPASDENRAVPERGSHGAGARPDACCVPRGLCKRNRRLGPSCKRHQSCRVGLSCTGAHLDLHVALQAVRAGECDRLLGVGLPSCLRPACAWVGCLRPGGAPDARGGEGHRDTLSWHVHLRRSQGLRAAGFRHVHNAWQQACMHQTALGGSGRAAAGVRAMPSKAWAGQTAPAQRASCAADVPRAWSLAALAHLP